MNLLPFDTLPAHKPRRFVPEKIDLGDWKPLAPLFDRLESLAAQCHSAADLERWLLEWSELSAALDEESSRRYIAMTCHTDNMEAEKAYLHFVEQIAPRLKPRVKVSRFLEDRMAGSETWLRRLLLANPLSGAGRSLTGFRNWPATAGVTGRTEGTSNCIATKTCRWKRRKRNSVSSIRS